MKKVLSVSNHQRNVQIKWQWGIASPVRLASTKKNRRQQVFSENVGEFGTLFSVGGNTKWYSCGNLYGGSSKKFKIGLPCNPAIPFLVNYPKELKSRASNRY